MDIPSSDPHNLPRRTEHLPRWEGDFVQTHASFIVDEIPAYMPCGEGEHVFVRFEKQDLTTKQVCALLEKELSIPSKDIGYAGMKDKRATARQWISVRGASEEEICRVLETEVKILECERHRNKLRLGHMQGNRFTLHLPVEGQEAFERGQAICSVLSTHGMPNFYGPQRFGHRGLNASDGKAVLLGKRRAKGAKRRFLISSYQSTLFNDILAWRMSEGKLDQALLGDVMQKWGSGGQFHCEDPDADQARMDALEIHPTGCMPGYKMTWPKEEPGAWEEALLEREELTPDDFRAVGKIAMGTRRSLRIPIEQLELSHEHYTQLKLQFILPSGSYASILLHELGLSFRS